MTNIDSLVTTKADQFAVLEAGEERRWRVYGDGRFLGLARQQQQLLNPFRVIPISNES